MRSVIYCAILMLSLTLGAHAQGYEQKCLDNVNDICGRDTVTGCFSNDANWGKILPACEGDVQTMIENEREALAQQNPLKGAALGGKVRQGPGTEHPQTGSLTEGTGVDLIYETGMMFNGYPWFEVGYAGPDGHQRTGYVWGGILCSMDIDIYGVYSQCPAAWRDMEQNIAPHHGGDDQSSMSDKGYLRGEDEAEMAIADCLIEQNANGANGSACVGHFANPCNDRSEAYARGDASCAMKEHAVWDKVLNAEYKKLMALTTDDAVRTNIRNAQRSWIDFAEGFCPLSYQITGGSMDRVTSAMCKVRTTANQAFELYRLAALQSEPVQCAITHCE